MTRSIDLIILLFSVAFAIFLISMNFSTFDASFHTSLSENYKTFWFTLTDIKQAGGLDLSSYPPLTHQIVALLLFVFPLEISYSVVLLTFWMILSYFSSKFLLTYLEIKYDYFWLIYLFIFFSLGILKTIFVFGQLTTIVGLGFGSISLYYFNLASRQNSTKNFLFSSLTLALTAFSHLLSFILITIFYIFLIIFEWKLILKARKKFFFFSILTFAILSLVFSNLISQFLFDTLIPLKEISHDSRYPLLPENINAWFYTTYGITFLAILIFPFINILKIKNKKKYFFIYLISIFFLLIGLGRTTFLPKLLFNNFEYWLTYDRFSLMASIIFAFLLVITIYESLKFHFKEKLIFKFFLIFIGFYLIFNISELFLIHEGFFHALINYKNTLRQNETEYVLNFLNKSVSINYRYQTFGFGRPIGDIYLYTNMPTLDTNYYTGRTINWLRNSGIEEIDQVNDQNFLNMFMNHTNEYSVKYIITFTPYYHNFMSIQKWTIIENKSFDHSNVIIWENPNHINPIKPIQEKITIVNYLWGIIPIATFLIFIFTIIYDFITKKFLWK